jgi:hypothetical protein
MFRLLLLILWAVSLPSIAGASDRCQSYSQEVRKAHAYYFGIDFPWHYSVAQLQQESNCRDVISKDGIGSQGAAQITYRWWKKPLAKAGITEITSRRNHLRAQAYINFDAWGQNRYKRLWISYQIYNGGRLVLKEIKKAGFPCWELARKECNRKIITFSSGQKIDACDINYDYSKKIYEYSETYRMISDSDKFKFW